MAENQGPETPVLKQPKHISPRVAGMLVGFANHKLDIDTFDEMIGAMKRELSVPEAVQFTVGLSIILRSSALLFQLKGWLETQGANDACN